MKLWQKNNNSPSGDEGKEVEKFTVGNDREFDMLLAPFDVIRKHCACKNVGDCWFAYK